MEIDLKELENKINYEIQQNKKQLETYYQTLDEVNEYGWETVFNANSPEETIKSSFNNGRTIGELEGENYQLTKILQYFYEKEMNK